MNGHPFWWLLTVVTLVWYLTVTLLVAIKGSRDIFQMLADLKGEKGHMPERSGSKESA